MNECVSERLGECIREFVTSQRRVKFNERVRMCVPDARLSARMDARMDARKHFAMH